MDKSQGKPRAMEEDISHKSDYDCDIDDNDGDNGKDLATVMNVVNFVEI